MERMTLSTKTVNRRYTTMKLPEQSKLTCKGDVPEKLATVGVDASKLNNYTSVSLLFLTMQVTHLSSNRRTVTGTWNSGKLKLSVPATIRQSALLYRDAHSNRLFALIARLIKKVKVDNPFAKA
jgi:hypothetical protein